MIVCVFMLFFSLPSAQDADEPRFDDFFEDRVLRVDLFQFGTTGSERMTIDEMREEPIYAGPLVNLVDKRDLGSHRFDVYDASSKRLIYRRGFCTLFHEWETTEKARSGAWRVFEHTLILPYPKKAVILSVSKRNNMSRFEELLNETIDMDRRYIKGELPCRNLKTVKIKKSGDPHDKVDVVILGDGYTAKEMGKYVKDAKRVADGLLSYSPMKELHRKFNIWAVESPSLDSGIDEPRKESFKSTVFGSTFNTFDLPRYSMTTEVKALHDVAACVPYDTIIVIFNSPRYGGGGIFNLYAMVTGNNGPPGVVVHEFGHCFAGLADEYYTSSVTYVDFYPEVVEPWEPNLTALLDPNKPKWGDLIKKGTPVPTPDEGKFGQAVGCFEGGGYRAKGIYRPFRNCTMRSTSVGFCPLCTRVMEEAIRLYAP